MKLFPSERQRQASDSRTVSWFFLAMFVLLAGYAVTLALHWFLHQL